jgi:hypothetical protein
LATAARSAAGSRSGRGTIGCCPSSRVAVMPSSVGRPSLMSASRQTRASRTGRACPACARAEGRKGLHPTPTRRLPGSPLPQLTRQAGTDLPSWSCGFDYRRPLLQVVRTRLNLDHFDKIFGASEVASVGGVQRELITSRCRGAAMMLVSMTAASCTVTDRFLHTGQADPG